MSNVSLEITDSVALLTLDDVKRKNAMTVALGEALQARVAELNSRSGVRAVVLTGGGGAFSAGGDLSMLEALRQSSFDDAKAHMLAFYSRYLSLLDLTVPTIAAIEGPAIGAGLCVAIACDLVITANDAKLAFNFSQLGLHPGMGATYFVPRRAGAMRAAELLYGGRRFDGAEAVTLGLALESVAPGQAVTRALALARTFASSAPLAVKGLKRTLAPDRQALQRALENEAIEQAHSYASADLGEGLAAITARRAPVFIGR